MYKISGRKKLKMKRGKQLGRLFLSCVSLIFIFRTGTEKNAWENFCVVVWLILTSIHSLTWTLPFLPPLMNSLPPLHFISTSYFFKSFLLNPSHPSVYSHCPIPLFHTCFFPFYLFDVFSLPLSVKEALLWKCWMQLFNVWSIFYHP